MGIWGPKLYEDDLAEDIKNEYEELLEKGKTNKEAIEDICQIYKEEIEDSDERAVFWMVLADILYKHKNLTKFVKEKALKEIELGENLKRWKNEASKEDYIKRKKELENLRKKLYAYKDHTSKIISKNKNIKKQEKIKTEDNKNIEWAIGDTYAYRIENPKYEGQYFILRKVQDCMYNNNTRYQSAIIYVQITSDKKIPKNEEEISELEYIIIGNEGNVKHEYRMQLYQVPRKKNEKLIYLGNFKNIITPKDEYIETEQLNIWLHSFKDIEYLIRDMTVLGTNKNPIYYEVDPKNISDSHIRFLMKVKYYKEKLNIIPPDKAIVKDDPLLYIALVDSLMIGGFVKNPVAMNVKDMENEAYNRIQKLKEMVSEQNSTEEKKTEKIKILEDLRKRIELYEGDSWDINKW